MSIPGGGSPLLLGGAVGYKIERSIRLNASDSAYLSRTPASAGNRKTWTWSGWVKRSALTANNYFFGCETATTQSGSLYFSFDTGTFNVLSFGFFWRTTTAVFRDPSAWFHLVVAVDTTELTANNRIRIYFNGVEQTSFSTLNNPTQNADLGINQAAAHVIGDYKLAGNLFYSGYLADIHFIDGQALTPSSFAETNATTGQWVPKAFSGGSYGTNGFRLAFADNSNNTATTLGKDTSGNGNNWTPNNLSVTAGAGNDSLTDTPTSYGTDTGAGGEVRGNYCTLNPLDSSTGHTLTNGNLDITANTTAWKTTRSTISIPTSDKWYAEFTLSTVGNAQNTVVGFAPSTLSTATYVGGGSNSICFQADSTIWTNNVPASGAGATYAANDVMQIAVDRASGKAWLGKNGTWIGSGNPAAGTNATTSSVATTGELFFAVSVYASGNSVVCNFGQRPFAYTAPSGFKALVDTNLPAPVVAKSSDYFQTVLYTGNGSTQTISGLGFSPDLVWIKARGAAAAHNLYDIIRGTSKPLYSNGTNAEATNPSNYGVSAFNSDGFSVSDITDGNYSVNGAPGGVYSGAGAPYVAWAFDAGSNTVSNTAGSITSQVRANASAGFSIVTYTGTGSAATVGHGLGVAPRMVIVKRRNGGGTENWMVYHASITSPSINPAANRVLLNLTNASNTDSAIWNDTQPTSTVFSVGTSSEVNANTGTYVAYCFAPVAGYSSFGSYTGNGSADGPFVFTGMRPRWIMLKRTDSTGNWTIIDTAREGYNVDNDPLYPNLSNAEGTADLADILSNGFKLRSTDTSVNASAGTYVYACFAEAPFALARAR